LANVPAKDVFFVGQRGFVQRVKGDDVATGQRAVRAHHVVGKHQGVAARGVLEVPVDALGFAQPGDEQVVAFVVLDGVGPVAVCAGELFAQGVAVFTEHVLHDVGHCHVLEDFEVAAPRGQPQPGPQGEPVGDVGRGVLAVHAKAADDAVQVALALALGLYHHRAGLAQQGLGIDALALREQVNLEFKQPAEFFHALELAKL
jgi:hypothetical protein